MWKGSSTGRVTIATGNSPPQAVAATSSRPEPRSRVVGLMHSPHASTGSTQSFIGACPRGDYAGEVGALQTPSTHPMHDLQECQWHAAAARPALRRDDFALGPADLRELVAE